MNRSFGLKWRRAPRTRRSATSSRGSIRARWRPAFRRHAALLQAARTKPGTASIALDGKTLRGSFDRFHDRTAAHVLSAFATDTKLVLAHVEIGEKSSEIPAAQALLAELGIAKDTLVTWMPCTAKKAFNVAQAGNISLIVQVKDNQPTLKQAIHHIATSSAPYDVFRTRDRGRNRDETRTVSAFNPACALAGTDWHPHVTAIIQVERAIATRNPETGLLKLTHDTAFYVANTSLTAAIAAKAIRAHWGIENSSHYVRDVTFAEDRSRIRTNPWRHRPIAQLRLQHPDEQQTQRQHPQPGPLPRRACRPLPHPRSQSLSQSVEQP